MITSVCVNYEMYLIDTSVWIDVFRDREKRKAAQLRKRIGSRDIGLSRFTQMELLQGARNQQEWELLDHYLSAQHYLEMQPTTWSNAARLYFNLRRIGKTVRSPIDCCIAQTAIDHQLTLLHRDKDFITLATIAPLEEEFLEWVL